MMKTKQKTIAHKASQSGTIPQRITRQQLAVWMKEDSIQPLIGILAPSTLSHDDIRAERLRDHERSH
jgi:hypothetical protein